MQLTKIICAAAVVASVALVDQAAAQTPAGCSLISRRNVSSRSACERRCDSNRRCDEFTFSRRSCRIFDCDSDRVNEENERQAQFNREEGEENARVRENDPNTAARDNARELDRHVLRRCTQIGSLPARRVTSNSACDRECERVEGCDEGVFNFFRQDRCTFQACGPNAADFISREQAEQNERNSNIGR